MELIKDAFLIFVVHLAAGLVVLCGVLLIWCLVADKDDEEDE